jgi:hypothetical protein
MTNGADECSQSTGQTYLDTETSESLPDTNSNPLISSAGGFHVRTSATPESVQESTVNAPGSGETCFGSFAWLDRDTSSWRTYQHSLFGGLTLYSGTWPRAGSMRNGIAYQRPLLVPHTYAIAYSYLPTPDASMGTFSLVGIANETVWFNKETTGKRKSGTKIGSSLTWCREFIHERLRTGGELNPEWIELLMGYPTGWTDLKDSETP